MKKTSTINKISVLLKGQLKFPKGSGGGGGEVRQIIQFI